MKSKLLKIWNHLPCFVQNFIYGIPDAIDTLFCEDMILPWISLIISIISVVVSLINILH